MSRASRLAAAWGMALLVAIVLNLSLTGPMIAPEPGTVAGGPTATPRSSLPPGYADEVLPPFPHWPPPNGGGGTARLEEPTPLDPIHADGLQAAADRARDHLGLHALAVGVSIRGGGTWAGASGLARDGRTPLDGDSPFAIASITKTFTATLVMQLVDAGQLALDDRVATILPEAGIDPDVTVEQLLAHTSGIADLLHFMREPMNADPDRVWTGAEVIARLGGPWFAPGADYGYSNSNYVLLGMIVEKVNGRPFADVLTDRLLAPLGLEETGVLTGEDAPALMTPSWASAFGTSGYMYSSASDLVRWGDALYGGAVLDPATTWRMLTFGEEEYGLGTERVPLGGRTAFGHSGLLRGFTSLLIHLPVEGVTLVVIGTWQGFDPATALTWSEDGRPSILDVALDAAGVTTLVE